MKNLVFGFLFVFFTQTVLAQQPADRDERFRPQVHYTPMEHWVNDPNGMVYFDGIYHLFYQYYPGASVWGPMHWGHATSTDLVHWERKPIALYPDSIGTIFSGSAVVDSLNTSGFGKDGIIPLVAIFTQHDQQAADKGSVRFQTQGIAYSLDNGESWTKYDQNPVLPNPGIVDFRDPKVMWFAKERKWVMTLATKDCISFYSSPDLKVWKAESVFGKAEGSHNGVWECPDLFSIQQGGHSYWILIVNVGSGAPNGGSGTQYFIGDFDGSEFRAVDTMTRWLDYGPDEYAGISWSNTGERKIFLGWLSNWRYANQVPTEKWRGGFTIPRDLFIFSYKDTLYAGQQLIPELDKLNAYQKKSKSEIAFPARMKLEFPANTSFSIVFSNAGLDTLRIGFELESNRYFVDRSKAGIADFHKEFADLIYAPRLSAAKTIDFELLFDSNSVELFADSGRTVMTALFFPNAPYTNYRIQTNGKGKPKPTVQELKSIW